MDNESRPFAGDKEPARSPEPSKQTDTMKLIILSAIIAIALPSCSNIPAGIIQPGTQGYVTQLGGKMKLTTAHANLELDNEASFKAATKTLDNGIIAWAATKIIDGLDTNATDVDKANIDAQAQATSQQNANAAAKEANRHTETMATLAEEPIIPTIQTP